MKFLVTVYEEVERETTYEIEADSKDDILRMDYSEISNGKTVGCWDISTLVWNINNIEPVK